MLFLLGYIDENAMTNIEDILPAIFIGLVVATFLLNTGRALKATEVCKECLIFLENKALKTEGEISNLLHIYQTIFRAYCLIPDHTKAEIYGRKLLDIYRKCGKKDEELNIAVALADIYEQQYKYLEARELYQQAINITKQIGDRKNEASTDERLELYLIISVTTKKLNNISRKQLPSKYKLVTTMEWPPRRET